MTIFASDSFTDASATALASHAAELGGPWVEHTSYATGDAQISNANRARCSTSNNTCYWLTGTPASADYDVASDLYVASVTGSGSGPAGRIDTAANTMYFCRHNPSGEVWQLFKLVAGTSTQLGSSVAEDLSVADNRAVVLRMVGDQISLLVASVVIIGPITDSAITAAGKSGFRGSLGSDSTGYHLDNFVATDTAVAAAGSRRMLMGIG